MPPSSKRKNNKGLGGKGNANSSKVRMRNKHLGWLNPKPDE